jgi:hypothetical protein
MKSSERLRSSYLNLRTVIGVLGLALPLLVAFLGFLELGLAFKGSISAYYYTNARDVFVAVLATIAIFLLSYRGYGRIDDVATNLSGLFALGTLVFPTYRSARYEDRVGLFLLNDRVSDIAHTSFAAAFFLSLAFISIFLFTRSRETGSSLAKRRRNRLYRACGAVMIVSIVLIVVYLVFLQRTPLARFKPVLILESVALFAFGTSWLVKGKTFMARTRSDRRVSLERRENPQ